MSDLNTQFVAAREGSKDLARRPDDQTMLKLYALYKQATAGDAPEDGPGDMVGMFKHRSWLELRGVGADDAKQRYIDLVARLK